VRKVERTASSWPGAEQDGRPKRPGWASRTVWARRRRKRVRIHPSIGMFETDVRGMIETFHLCGGRTSIWSEGRRG
jgi:hypothetical protein